MDASGFTFLVGLAGGFVGAGGAVCAQFVNHWLTSGREHARFKIQSFERFASRLDSDELLGQIRNKSEPYTDDEYWYYLGFWEDIGLYFVRDLVDVELLDGSFGDDIMDCYLDDATMKWIGSVRGEERDDSYFICFERMAKDLIRRKRDRLKEKE